MTIYSTVWSSRPRDFEEGLVVLQRDRHRRKDILRTLWGCREGDVVILNGAPGYEDLWFDLWLAVAVRARGRRVGVIISDATWHPRSTRADARVPRLHGVNELFVKLMMTFACGERTHVCFLSRAETTDFSSRTGVPPQRVHFTPFFPTIRPRELRHLGGLCPTTGPAYVFSGGNSSRDYGLLVAALRGSDHLVRVATRSAQEWPDNFVVCAEPHGRFLELMAGSAAVAICLRTDTVRSVGQQTYLNAMLLGLPVIVNDAPGVRDYVEHKVNALIVPADDPGALRSAIDWVLDPANEAEVGVLRARARAAALAHGPEAYYSNLKALAQGVHRSLQLQLQEQTRGPAARARNAVTRMVDQARRAVRRRSRHGLQP